MNAGALVPVIVAGLQEKYTRAFHEAGATSPATAKTLEHVGCRESPVFDDCVRQGLFVAIDAGKYYLDTDVMESLTARRRVGLFFTMAVLAVGLVIFMLLK